MSKCGKCRNKSCSCSFIGDNASTKVIGLGASYQPYQVRPKTMDFRPVGAARRTSSQTIILNTDTPITFESNLLPFSAPQSMWSSLFPTRLTAPIAGLYLVGGYASIPNAAGSIWRVWLSKNNIPTAPLVKRSVSVSGVGYLLSCSVMTLVRLNANDYIELYVRTTSTAGTCHNSAFGDMTANFMDPNIYATWMGA